MHISRGALLSKLPAMSSIPGTEQTVITTIQLACQQDYRMPAWLPWRQSQPSLMLAGMSMWKLETVKQQEVKQQGKLLSLQAAQMRCQPY